jgi:hypothetical protein
MVLLQTQGYSDFSQLDMIVTYILFCKTIEVDKKKQVTKSFYKRKVFQPTMLTNWLIY